MDVQDKFVAAKPFNTVNRHIAQGEVITRDDIESGDRNFDALRQRGFIVGYDTKAADKAAHLAADAGGLVISGSPAPVPPPDVPPSDAGGVTKPGEPVLRRPRR